MRILYVAPKYDYGEPTQGYSYEHYNFFESLRDLGHDILYFDFLTLLRERGGAGMNQRLLEVARVEQPAIMFSVLLRDELDPTIVNEISTATSTRTVNWFCDDHWRFDSFSRHWAPRFNWVITTASSALPKYRAIGYENVIKSQWGCNQARYRPVDVPHKYDVSFVGLPHGDRRHIVEQLRRARIDVNVWGKGWERGRISQDEMIRVFSESRINLNLTNSSASRSLVVRALDAGMRLTEKSRLAPQRQAWLARRLARLRYGIVSRSASATVYPDQIKGRNFEVPACKSFLLTGRAENLEEYFRPAAEVGCFDDVDDLIDNIRYYLEHPDERTAAASAGYARALSEHTYAHRFDAIFNRLGLPSPPLADALAGRLSAGQVEDVR